MATTAGKSSLTPGTVKTLRDRLLGARQAAFADLGVAEEDLRWIEQDRESEFEERAQDAAAGDVLSRRGEQNYRAIRAIQDALDRLADGTYGSCASCREPIAVERLLAAPEASMCAECAVEAEGNWVRRLAAESAREGEAPAPPTRALASELVGLSDAETTVAVRERLRAEMGEALDDLRIVCRHGVITLAGEVASDELRDAVLRILEADLGLELVDHMRVSTAAGESPRRGKE
jgi:RNA polymerase-binding transcription factor DksA